MLRIPYSLYYLTNYRNFILPAEITVVKRMSLYYKYTRSIALSESTNRCKAQAGHGERREDLVKLSVGIRAATLTHGINIDFINKQS